MKIWLCLLFFALLPGVAAQDAPTGQVNLGVVSVERREAGFRVTLRGEMDARDGALYLMRISPLVYHVAGDGRSLALAASEVGSVFCRVEVKKGRFTALFDTGRLGQEEIRLSPFPNSSGVAPQVIPIFLPEAGSARTRLKGQIRLVHDQIVAVREFILGLEPHSGPGSLIPAGHLKRLLQIEKEIVSWALKTDFTATALALRGLVTEIVTTAPWDLPVPAEEKGLSRPTRKPPSELSLRVDDLKRKTAVGEGIALREGVLRILTPLGDLVGDLSAGAPAKGVRQAIPVLCGLFSLLETGELAEVYRSTVPDLATLVSLTDEAVESLPDPPVSLDEGSLENLRSLHGRLVQARDGIANGQNP